MNLKITLPTTESHPNFLPWKLGYTPEQVYDLFFPKNFRFICNAERPAVCGRFGPLQERLWRLEFVVKQGEDPMLMSSDAKTMGILMPYLTHPGSKYRLEDPYASIHNKINLTMTRASDLSVQFPSDCINVLRSRPFAFSARRCNKFSVDRVLLAGDAAHVFPPCKHPLNPFLKQNLMRSSWWPRNCIWVPRRCWTGLAPRNCNQIEHNQLPGPVFWLV